MIIGETFKYSIDFFVVAKYKYKGGFDQKLLNIKILYQNIIM